ELRPGSYLVTPTLGPARRVLLGELNIDWLPMTAEQFANEVLANLSAEADDGQELLRARFSAESRRRHPNLVGELAAASPPPSPDYLLGREPTWSDVSEGIAVVRESDEEIYKVASSVLKAEEVSPPLVVAGTAGSGKSTAL